jgi:hypothetical protein
MALLKADRAFSNAYVLAASPPGEGGRLYSLGYPMGELLTVIEGLMAGIQRSPLRTRLQMSAPLNPGMSGGPFLNDRGEVVGINEAIRRSAQNMAYAGESKDLARLIAEALARGLQPLANPKGVLAGQLDAALGSWFEKAALPVPPGRALLGPFEVGDYPSAECLVRNESLEKKFAGQRIDWRFCQVNQAVYLSSAEYAGLFEVEYLSVFRERGSAFGGDDELWRAVEGTRGEERGLILGAGLTGGGRCSRGHFRNARGLVFEAQECVLPTRVPGLVNATVFLTHVSGGGGILAVNIAMLGVPARLVAPLAASVAASVGRKP